jgi:hypothetical protein
MAIKVKHRHALHLLQLGPCETIQYNYARNIKKGAVKEKGQGKFIFSPGFVYSTVIRIAAKRDPKITCNSGISFQDALMIIRDSGVVLLDNFNFDPRTYNCYSPIDTSRYAIAKKNKIRDFKPM